jgi:protocatechuate 4,5-dioxygenase alpha subunit
MARQSQDYDDIPGTFVFDAERSRKGCGINMFCMSLMKEDNRRAFKANGIPRDTGDLSEGIKRANAVVLDIGCGRGRRLLLPTSR